MRRALAFGRLVLPSDLSSDEVNFISYAFTMPTQVTALALLNEDGKPVMFTIDLPTFSVLPGEMEPTLAGHHASPLRTPAFQLQCRARLCSRRVS